MGLAWRRALLRAICAVVIANYVAQIAYYLRLYYFPQHAPPSLGGALALAATLAWFLVGWALLWRGRTSGYWLTLSYLGAMTAFYLANTLNQVAHGYAPFFHLANPDPVLWVVFAIGYLNMLAGAGVIFALLLWRSAFRSSSSVSGARIERRGALNG